MTSRKKAIVSAIAGAALLAGTGATFALWSTDAALTGGEDGATISIGHFTLDASEGEFANIEWANGWDNWHPLLSDTGVVTLDINNVVNLLGDNLYARLTFVPAEEFLENGIITEADVTETESGFIVSDVNGFWTFDLAVDSDAGLGGDLLDGGVILTPDNLDAVTDGGLALTVDLRLDNTAGGPQDPGAEFDLFAGAPLGEFVLVQVDPADLDLDS